MFDLKQPEHVPGMHAMSDEELTRYIYTDASATTRERALADRVETLIGVVAALEDREEVRDNEATEAEEDHAKEVENLEVQLAYQTDAADAFRETLRGLLASIEATEEACNGLDIDGDVLAEAKSTLLAYPSESERKRTAREREERDAAHRAELRAEVLAKLPDFPAWEGKPARVLYKVPRGRVWHEAGRNYRMDVNAAHRALHFVPRHDAEVRITGQ